MHNSRSFLVDGWTVEPDLDRISRGEERKMLRPQVMALLVYLANRSREVCQPEDLFRDLWPNKVVSDATLYNCVAELRHHLDDGSDSPSSIQTIPKRGYRLVGEVRLDQGPTREKREEGQLPARPGPALVLAGIGSLMIVATVFFINGYFEVARPVVTAYRKLSTSQVIMPPVSSPLAITADDSRLYFTQFLDGTLTLSELAQSGGETKQLKLPISGSDTVSGVNGMTPDNAGYLIEHYSKIKTSGARSPELWTVPVVGGSPRRLGRGRQGTFSRSGDRLLFMRDSLNMFIGNADMTETRQIASLPHRVYWPRFSPDGTRIRFTQEVDQFASTLWELKLDGSEPYRLLGDRQELFPCCGSWTPDGKYYVFQGRTETGTQLWGIENSVSGDIESSEPFQITSGAIDFLRPTISADGKTIFAIGWQLRGEVNEYDVATGSFRPVSGLESMSVEQISYSQDQQMVAYVTYPDGTLWRKGINENQPLQLTFGPLRAAQPVWSPDGSKIAFTGWVPGEAYKIFVVFAIGGHPRLISGADTTSWSPSWSSNGERLVFSDANSERLQVYDFNRTVMADLPGTGGYRSPIWSPDGKSIVASSGSSLVLYDVSSQRSTILLENARYNFKYWAAESDALYLVDSFWMGRERSVYRLTIADNRLSKVAVVGHLRNTWGTVGQWVGVNPDGAPLILRDQSIHNIYALDWNPD